MHKHLLLLAALLPIALLSCRKMVDPDNPEEDQPTQKTYTCEPVDLGLSVKWGRTNLGAVSANQPGDYFAWGETLAKDVYSWTVYRWCDGKMRALNKYNTYKPYGVVDNLLTLEGADDAASVLLGGDWRMPTSREIDELVATRDNPGFAWEWKKLKDHYGWSVTNLESGNSIFLPAGGLVNANTIQDEGSYGFYWSCSLEKALPENAWCLYMSNSAAVKSDNFRCFGLSIRPVLP